MRGGAAVWAGSLSSSGLAQFNFVSSLDKNLVHKEALKFSPITSTVVLSSSANLACRDVKRLQLYSGKELQRAAKTKCFISFFSPCWVFVSWVTLGHSLACLSARAMSVLEMSLRR